MKTIFAGVFAGVSLCVSAMSAHAELITWHAQGLIKNPQPIAFNGTGPDSGSPDARTAAAAYFADGQHFTMDYVIDNDAVTIDHPGNEGTSYMEHLGALRSLDVHIAESGLSYGMTASQVSEGSIDVSVYPDSRSLSLTFFGNARGNGVTLESKNDPNAPTFSFITGAPPLPAVPAALGSDVSLKDLTHAMALAPVEAYQDATVILGTSQACNAVTTYCAIASLSLTSFTAGVVPEASTASQMGLGLGLGLGGFVSAAMARRRRRAPTPTTAH